jgi:hypothetical protein
MTVLDTRLDMIRPEMAAGGDVGTSGRSDDAKAVISAADCLGLAAAPTFAAMALLAGVSGGGPADMLCAALRDASPLGGMVPMYVLMSVFHVTPWLKMIGAWRKGRTS